MQISHRLLYVCRQAFTLRLLSVTNSNEYPRQDSQRYLLSKMVGPVSKLKMSLHSRLALSTALASIVLGGYGGRKAYAACSGAAGTYTCSGVLTTTQNLAGIPLNVTTDPGFGITTLAGNAFTLTGTGGLTFADNNYSTISGNDYGIWARNYGAGVLSITTTGTVEGTTYDGIRAVNNNNSSTNLMINTAAVKGGRHGIYTRNNGTGVLLITMTGAVEGTTNNGIYALNSNTGSTDLIINTAAVKGGRFGIIANNSGTRVLSITTTGAVEGTTFNGISARNSNIGSTDLTIATAAVTGGRYGIWARHDGTGVLLITTTGTVGGTGYDGIRAVNNNNSSTNLIINTAAVKGGRHGIYTRNNGTGVLLITMTGAVEGTTNNGIYAFNSNIGSTDLIINTAAVKGGRFGIIGNNNGTGVLSITSTGAVEGTTFSGISASNDGIGTTTITTTGAVTGDTGIRVGTRTNNSPATINTYAPITGTGGFAIDLRDDGHDVVNLGGGTVITGAIDFGNGNDGMGGFNPNDIDTLNALPGFNGVVTFADNQGDSDLQSAPEFVSPNIALINGGLTAVAVDPSGFAASGVFLGTFTSSIFNSIDNNGAGPESGVSTHQGPGAYEYGSGKRYWISGLGGYQEVDGGAGYADLDHHFGGVMIGMENGFATDTFGGTAGFFGGYAVSDIAIQYGAGGTDVDTVFGGAYLKQDYGSWRIHLAFVGGSADHEFSRVVGGAPSTTALGKADGWFISPSATIIAPLNLFAVPVEASVRASYAGLFLDGYTETGTAFPLSVADRNVHLFNTRAQLALPHYIANEDGSHSHFELRAGVDARFDAGSDNVIAAVGGTSINFQAALDDAVSGFVGATMSRTSADGGFTFTLSGEMQSTFDGGYQATGEAKAVFRF